MSRDFDDGALQTVEVRFTTRAGITADHELFRNLLLNGRIFATKRDFEGIDRDETNLDVSLGAKYMVNRHFYVLLDE